MDVKNLVSYQDFFAAVRRGDLEALKQLLEGPEGAGAVPGAESLMTVENEEGDTALYIAAENNMLELFQYLARFCDYDVAAIRCKKLEMTAFHAAAKKGYIGIVRESLVRWPEICRVCDPMNMSPLYSAAVKDHLEVVNAILDVDESTIRILRNNGKTALHTAARSGLVDIVKLLIDRDPGVVPFIDKKGQTALHMAVKGRNPDVVVELLSADNSILNQRDKKGNTALHMATRKWRVQMVRLLLNHIKIEVNVINNQNETAMDLAEKIPYSDNAIEIRELLAEAGAKNARHVGKFDEASEIRKTVIDIKQDVHDQYIQNMKTNKRVTGIAKELRKLHREAVQNTINSVTLVAVLIASIAFMAIFNLPGQYYQDGTDGMDVGQAYIAGQFGFRLFCLLNATALFISLAVVVVQITLVAWETGAQKLVVSVVNKLMWLACTSTCAAFLSLAFVVVGTEASWMAIAITAIGGPMMVGTLGILCYMVFRQYFKFNDDSQRRIKRGSGSKSFSVSYHSGISDPDAMYSDQEKKIYAL